MGQENSGDIFIWQSLGISPTEQKHSFDQNSAKDPAQILTDKCKVTTTSLGMESKPLPVWAWNPNHGQFGHGIQTMASLGMESKPWPVWAWNPNHGQFGHGIQNMASLGMESKPWPVWAWNQNHGQFGHGIQTMTSLGMESKPYLCYMLYPCYPRPNGAWVSNDRCITVCYAVSLFDGMIYL